VVFDAAGQQPDLLDQSLQGARQAAGEFALGICLEVTQANAGCLAKTSQQVFSATTTAMAC
jgi:hypothetical protein